MKISVERKNGAVVISFSEKDWNDLRSANGRLRTVKTEELRRNGGRHTVHHDVPAGCTPEEKVALKLEMALRLILPPMPATGKSIKADEAAEIRSSIADGVAKKAAADKKAASAVKGARQEKTGVAK